MEGSKLDRAGQLDESPRGVLDRRAADGVFEVGRHPPDPALAELVEGYWTVRWDLRGRPPHTQHTLPHPAVHLVAEPGRSWIFGVLTDRFTRVLEGRGVAFGVKFRPAGFRPFLGVPVARLTDGGCPVAEVFGLAGDALVDRLLAAADVAAMVAAADGFLVERRPPPDLTVAAVNRLVDLIRDDREITRVKDVVARTGVGARRLQRLFAGYVGVGPKWVIRRYRLHEAVERLAAGDEVDLAFLAADLGYADQSHFARDFKAAVGRPPAAYARSTSRPG